MKILRKGARADHGLKSVNLKLSKLRWNPNQDAFDVSFANAASDFSTDARHEYTIRVEPMEMSQIVQMLADEAHAVGSEEFAGVFGKATASLFKLQVAASGIKLAA